MTRQGCRRRRTSVGSRRSAQSDSTDAVTADRSRSEQVGGTPDAAGSLRPGVEGATGPGTAWGPSRRLAAGNCSRSRRHPAPRLIGRTGHTARRRLDVARRGWRPRPRRVSAAECQRTFRPWSQRHHKVDD